MVMKKTILIILITGLISFVTHAQEIRSVDAGWIQQIKDNKSDTLYVVNFWATWCKPCVHEMPVLDSIAQTFTGQKIKVVLVSNDFSKNHDMLLHNFIAKHQIKSEVVWMSETNPDVWIPLVNKDWSGAIPATWIFKNNMAFEFFKEGEISYSDLHLIATQTLPLK